MRYLTVVFLLISIGCFSQNKGENLRILLNGSRQSEFTYDELIHNRVYISYEGSEDSVISYMLSLSVGGGLIDQIVSGNAYKFDRRQTDKPVFIKNVKLSNNKFAPGYRKFWLVDNKDEY